MPLEHIFRDALAHSGHTDTSYTDAAETLAELLPVVDVLLAKHADRVREPRVADAGICRRLGFRRPS
jgi:hypothetical protein